MKKFLLFAVFLFSFSFTHNASASASASLLISSATVASDGVTVTVNISGVNTTLSCTASPCTGFSVTLVKTNSFIDYITNVAVSGSVATLTLSTPVLSGNTVKVSLASGASSNLTDSGNNTPSAAAGNTNATVTNSSAQIGVTAGISNPKLYLIGAFANQGGAGNPVNGDANSHIDFSCSSCTNVGISQYTSGSHLTVSIDGGAFNSVTPPSGAALHQWFSLASGLTNTSHTFSIKNITFVHTGDTIMVSSSTGATLNSISTLGRVYKLTSGGNNPYSDVYTDYGVFDGGPYNQGSYAQWLSTTDGALRFRSDCTAFSIYAYQNSSAYKVYRDGVVFGSVYQSPVTAAYDMIPVATGSDGAMHLWEIIIARAPTGTNTSIYGLMPIGCGGSGGNANGFGTKPSTLPAIMFNGDSTIDGNGGAFLPTSDKLGRDSFLVSRALGLRSYNVGRSGSKVATINSHDDLSPVFSSPLTVFPISQAPKYALLSEGTNDSTASTTLAQYQTNWVSWITKAASHMAVGGKIFVRSTYSVGPTFSNPSTVASYNTYEKAAVDQYNAGSPSIPAYYIATTNWVNGLTYDGTSTYDTGDGAHFTTTGFAKMANREIPIFNGLINGSSYTITNPGSLSGTAGTASGSFTVTLPGSATFTGDQTITLSDGGNGGTFTPSVGSAGVSPVTVTPTNGLTSFTFTYNPASAGTKTISFTHGQNNGQDVWVDPSSVSYSVISVAQNVTSQFAISKSANALNRATGRIAQTITLTNNGGTLSSAAYVLDTLPAAISVYLPSGYTVYASPVSSPYFEIGSIAAGAQVKIKVEYINPSNAPIGYNSRVIGDGSR